MIDVSDGIASDLERLCECSEVRIEAELDCAAARRRRRRRSRSRRASTRWSSRRLPGEDYELLFTAPAAARATVERGGRGKRLAGYLDRQRFRRRDGR